MATSRINIFNALPAHFSDDEDEGNTRTQGKGVQGKKTTGPRDDKAKSQKQGGNAGASTQPNGNKGKDDHKKGKGTPAPGTHPLERHSGTGYAAYDKKLKKGGAGKGNWGSNKNERTEENKEEDNTQENVEETQEPTGITLEEYYSKKAPVKTEPQINEAKAKITSDQLMKEVLSNKATVLPSRKSKEVEAKPAGKKKGTAEIEHHATLNTEHADLLNFRTGFIEREFRQRSDAEKSSPTKRETRPRDEKAEGQEKTEEQQPAEGEKAEVQEKGEQGEKRRGGYKGGNRDGYKKGSYKGGYNAQPKVNIEDESSFPKLG